MQQIRCHYGRFVSCSGAVIDLLSVHTIEVTSNLKREFCSVNEYLCCSFIKFDFINVYEDEEEVGDAGEENNDNEYGGQDEEYGGKVNNSFQDEENG